MAKPTLEVYLAGTLAGTLLRKDNGNLQFRYDRDYVEAKGPPLSLNLPLQTEAYPHGQGADPHYPAQISITT